MNNLEFTGERLVPGKTPHTIVQDHLARYEFASGFVRGLKVLDIACGTGYGSAILAENGAKHVTGVDISQEAIDYAHSNYERDNLAYLKDSIYDYFSAEPFDIITCFETIEHVDDFLPALNNLKKLLAPKGRLFISSPNRLITSPKRQSMDDSPGEFHVREFTINELRSSLEDTGFRILENNIYGQRLQLYPPTRFLRKIYDIFCKPKKRSSPEVRPLQGRMPRYFLLIAEK